MADICVLHLSDDRSLAKRLVSLLGKHWEVWCADHMVHGDWERAVRDQIRTCKAVVVLLSQHVTAGRTAILRDEIQFARSHEKPILPFVVGQAEIPFGLGGLNHTVAMGWDGAAEDAGYQELVEKVRQCVEPVTRRSPLRQKELIIGTKRLALPAFIYSVSSHETQVSPADGLELLNALFCRALLVSAYDIWRSRNRRLEREAARIRATPAALFLDSGNYEAYRKNDRYSRANPGGWRKEHFREVVRRLSPDVAFSFDSLAPRGTVDEIAAKTVRAFSADRKAIGDLTVQLCPIVHIPQEVTGSRGDFAAQLLRRVVSELDPPMVAVPERELGAGLRSRALAVRRIREELDDLGKYYPLHLLGTGNPISMLVLAVAGADTFDGLEWCRTAANYENGTLYHFQHAEFFFQSSISRTRDKKTRIMLADPEVPFTLKALSLNIDFFNDWTDTMRNLIHTGNARMLLRTLVPNVGPELAELLA